VTPPAAPSALDGRPLDPAIFVGGMPRSGTSLVRAILAAHPDVAMFPGELPLWSQLARAHAGQDLSRPAARERLVRDLVTHPRMKRAHVTLDGDALAAALDAEPVVRLGTVFALALRQYARQTGKPRWGAKDPRNEFHADRIFAELPAAAVIHMIRDPRDVLASQRAMWGRRAQHLVSTTDDWRRSAGLARRQAAGRDTYVVLRYEDLVTEPERIVRDVCRVLGLDYRPTMLDLAGQPLWPGGEAPEIGPGVPVISPSRIGRHRGEVPPGEIRYIEWRARREMRAWGYAPGTRVAADWARIARCLGEEGAWRAARRFGIWPVLSRALGRLPPAP